MSKFEVSGFGRAFEFLDWGDGLFTALFSATTRIIDTNGTAYEILRIGLSDTSNVEAKLVLVAK
jgi:hypothetical protein